MRALSRSKPLRFRFSSTPPRCKLSWACNLCPSQVRTAQVTKCLAIAVTPRWAVHLTTSPIPAAQFSECTRGAPSQVCCVPSSMTLPADVNRPESQELLVSNGACFQFGRGCLSGAAIVPFRLWLPPGCLSLAADGPVRSLLALLWYSLSALFYERAWQDSSVSLSLFFFFLSLWLSHSLGCYLRLVLSNCPQGIQPRTLSNAAHASLFSPHLLVVAVSAGS